MTVERMFHRLYSMHASPEIKLLCVSDLIDKSVADLIRQIVFEKMKQLDTCQKQIRLRVSGHCCISSYI